MVARFRSSGLRLVRNRELSGSAAFCEEPGTGRQPFQTVLFDELIVFVERVPAEVIVLEIDTVKRSRFSVVHIHKAGVWIVHGEEERALGELNPANNRGFSLRLECFGGAVDAQWFLCGVPYRSESRLAWQSGEAKAFLVA